MYYEWNKKGLKQGKEFSIVVTLGKYGVTEKVFQSKGTATVKDLRQ